MLKGFDKNKYPLDHNFIEYTLPGSIITNLDCYSNYTVKYRVYCAKCDIYINHEESENNNLFHCWIPLDKVLFSIKDKSKFDFTKVYSCAEMAIKKLLE